MDTSVADKIEQFFSSYPLRECEKGQILIYNDEAEPHIFHIVEGIVRQYDITYRGDEVVLNIYKAPAFFPMLTAMSGVPNHYFFEASTAVQVRVAPAKEVLEFLRQNPDVLYDLLRRVYTGMDGLLQRLAHLMGGSAKSRVLFELLIECRRFGEVLENGSCQLNIGINDLAARSGLARESVSREVRKLKQKGLLEVTGHGLLVTDVAAIEQTIGQTL